MKKVNPDRLHISDMLQAIDDIATYAKPGLQEKKTLHSILYNIAILGEAAARVSQEAKVSHSGIPWRQIISTRNKIIHEYGRVDLIILKDVVDHDLPELKQQLEKLLTALPS